MKKLWYENEAGVWEEALPIGNGRIGAMVFSGAVSDKLQINEDTLWSGYPEKHKKKHNISELSEIRNLIKQKKYHEATEKTSETMFNIASDAYLPYGNLYVDIICEQKLVENYRRELDLGNATVKSSYTLNGIEIEKETFVSQRDDVLVMHIKSAQKLDFHIYQAVNLEHSIKCRDNNLVVDGRCPTNVLWRVNIVEYDEDKESIHFNSATGIKANGQVYGGGNSLWVEAADDVTVIFAIKTSFNGYNKMPVSEGREYSEACKTQMKDIAEYSYAELKERHIAEYKKYFDRVELYIGGEDYSYLSTDKRIKRAAAGTVDNGLVTLLFDFGRYLTISSSREGTQPANLQGIWSYKLVAPWHSNYTLNINTQMNYWAVETTNLPECHMPFLKMLKELCEKGNQFNLRGWAAWHNTDIWRFNHEATDGVLWGYWIMGGFWGVRHIWEHYLHTKDIEFLREYYSVMVGATEFLEDWLIENEEGRLVTCPSTSPENEFVYAGKNAAVAMGSAMDMEIVYDVFDKTEKASAILGIDQARYAKIKEKLAPVKIGNDGRILEWGEEFAELEPGHRHISHLYGFFPSDVLQTEEYENAVKKSLEFRLKHDVGHRGWSNAWIANVYARLRDGEKVMEYIRNMFANSIYPNMLDAHPPFQIDGNFGICSAICEALLQSHKGETKILPALPKEWSNGYVKGFKSRTGETVSFEWKNEEYKIN